MKSNKVLFAAAVLLALALYNAIVFITVSGRTNVFWFTYGFTTAAFLMQLPVFLLVAKFKPEKEIVYSMPLTSISLCYFIVQLITGVVVMFAGAGLRVALVLQITILALYLIVTVLALIARNTVKSTAQNTAESVLFIKSMEQYVLSLAAVAASPDVSNKLTALAEKIRFSDPVSNPSLAEEENRISEEIAVLAEWVSAGNTEESGLFNKIEMLINERNRKCKMMK
jgi:hypothetical protein